MAQPVGHCGQVQTWPRNPALARRPGTQDVTPAGGRDSVGLAAGESDSASLSAYGTVIITIMTANGSGSLR